MQDSAKQTLISWLENIWLNFLHFVGLICMKMYECRIEENIYFSSNLVDSTQTIGIRDPTHTHTMYTSSLCIYIYDFTKCPKVEERQSHSHSTRQPLSPRVVCSLIFLNWDNESNTIKCGKSQYRVYERIMINLGRFVYCLWKLTIKSDITWCIV